MNTLCTDKFNLKNPSNKTVRTEKSRMAKNKFNSRVYLQNGPGEWLVCLLRVLKIPGSKTGLDTGKLG
jgi:hypothetical protein